MKKKYVQHLILATLCLFSLTSCGLSSSSYAKKPVSLKIWTYYNGLQQMTFEQQVKEFNDTVGAKQGIVVEAFSHGSIPDLTDSLLASANKKVGAEAMPNLYSAYPDTAFTLDRMGLVANLTPYFSEKELSEYRSEYLEEGNFTPDTLKIFPIAKSTELLFVNKTDWDTFSAASEIPISSLKTMEGVVQTAKAYYEWTDSLTPEPDDGKAFFGRDSMANYLLLGAKQLDMPVYSVKDGKVTHQLDEATFRTLWDNYYVPYINGYFYANGRFRSDDMKTNNLIAYVGSTSSASYFPSEVTVNDTETYPIESMILKAPYFASGTPYAIQQGAGLVVTKANKKVESAACEFLKWFTEANRNTDFSISSGYLPVKNAACTLDSLEQASEASSTPINEHIQKSLTLAVSQMDDTPFYSNPVFANGSEARSILEQSMSDQASADLASIQELIASGTSRSDAISQYDTDENFTQWFQSIQTKLVRLDS